MEAACWSLLRCRAIGVDRKAVSDYPRGSRVRCRRDHLWFSTREKGQFQAARTTLQFRSNVGTCLADSKRHPISYASAHRRTKLSDLAGSNKTFCLVVGNELVGIMLTTTWRGLPPHTQC